MNRGLRPLDMDEVEEAVELLRENGFAVDGVDNVRNRDSGVEFSLHAYAPSRSAGLDGEGEL